MEWLKKEDRQRKAILSQAEVIEMQRKDIAKLMRSDADGCECDCPCGPDCECDVCECA